MAKAQSIKAQHESSLKKIERELSTFQDKKNKLMIQVNELDEKISEKKDERKQLVTEYAKVQKTEEKLNKELNKAKDGYLKILEQIREGKISTENQKATIPAQTNEEEKVSDAEDILYPDEQQEAI